MQERPEQDKDKQPEGKGICLLITIIPFAIFLFTIISIFKSCTN